MRAFRFLVSPWYLVTMAIGIPILTSIMIRFSDCMTVEELLTFSRLMFCGAAIAAVLLVPLSLSMIRIQRRLDDLTGANSKNKGEE